MNKHIVAETVLGILLLVLLLAIAKDQFQHAIETAKVDAKVEARADAQKQYDQNLKDIRESERLALEQRDAAEKRYEAATKRLHDMTPQQIVQAAPNFISGLPRPITIWEPGVTPPVAGDAIVPQEDIHAIAQNVLDGNHCIKDRLPNCVNLLNLSNQKSELWNKKFDLKDMDAKDWEKEAKKSDFGRKLKRCGLLGAIGFGVGVAPNDPARLRNGAIGAGVVGISCLFIK